MTEQLQAFLALAESNDDCFDVAQAGTDEAMNSTFDEIMHYWALPNAKLDGLNSEQVGELLTAGNNTIPLWVVVKPTGSGRYRLTVSRRFRKRKVVRQWHGANATYPFMRKERIQHQDALDGSASRHRQ